MSAEQAALRLHGGCTKTDVQPKNAPKEVAQMHVQPLLHGGCTRIGAKTLPTSECLIPETPHMNRRQRAEAFNAWVDAGKPWPPPAGLASSLIGAVMTKHRERRW